jgi:hypothetical protein
MSTDPYPGPDPGKPGHPAPEPPQPCVAEASLTAEASAPGHVQCKKCGWWHKFVDATGEALGDAFGDRG